MAAAKATPATPAAEPDLKKRLAPLFNPPRNPVLVDVPELGYLMIDGKGAPDEGAEYPTTDFQKAFAAFFPVAYTIGTDFRPATRPPAETVTYWDGWGES